MSYFRSANQSVDDVIVLSDDDDDDDYYYKHPSSEDDSEDEVVHVNNEIESTAITRAETDQDNSADEINYKGKKLIKQLYCNKCGDLFSDFVVLHRHIFAKNHVFSCEKCNKKIGHTVSQLREHTKMDCHEHCDISKDSRSKTDLNVLKYYCERCGQGFSVLAKLIEHYKIHVNELICCPLCSIRSASFDGLMSHFKSHTVINNVELICKVCDLHFYAIHPYRMHCILVHSHFVNIPYNCILCTQIFKDHKEFLWHVQSHTKLVIKTKTNPHRPDKNVTSVTCEICAQIFEDTESCKEHKDMCHDINSLRQAQEACPVCSQTFNVMELPSHISHHKDYEAINTSEKSAQKDDKLQASQSPQGDQQSKRKNQTKVKCYTCKEMVLLATIEEHRESHKFKCSLCPRCFNTNQGLNNHMISHNSVETNQMYNESTDQAGSSLPFNQPTCNECGRTFLSLYALREHSRSHNMNPRADMSWSSSSFQEDFTVQTQPEGSFSKRPFPPSRGNSKAFLERSYYSRDAPTAPRGFSYGSPQMDNATKGNEYFDYQAEPSDISRSSETYTNHMVRNPFSGNPPASLMSRRSEFPEDQVRDYHSGSGGRFGQGNFRR